MRKSSGRVKVLDRDTLSCSPPNSFWRMLNREDTLILDGGDDRQMFFIKSDEPIRDAAVRLSEMAGWKYVP